MIPDITFIIAAYNAAETVAETLEGLLAQSSRRWLATIVDDGSSDATADVVARFVRRDARFSYTRIANSGVSRARNHGLALATTRLVTFLDADDWVHPSFVQAMVQSASEVDLVYCAYARVAPNGKRTTAQFDREVEHSPFSRLGHLCPFAIHAVVARRELLVEVGGFDADLETCEDSGLVATRSPDGGTV